MTNREEIEKLIDTQDDEIRSLHLSWDKGDCSKVGLARILLIQEIKTEIKERGEFYDGQYDELLLALSEKYNT